MEANNGRERSRGGGGKLFTPRIALVVPVFNTEKYIAECLSSIIAQSYSNFVAFIIDDGSIDSSAKIASEFVERDPRLKFIQKKNGGVSSVRNLALDIIEKDGSFDYVAFIDSDDVITVDYFNIILNSVKAGPPDGIFIGVEVFDKLGRRIQKKPYRKNIHCINEKEIFDFAFCMGAFYKSKSPASFFGLCNLIFSGSIIKGFRFNEALSVGEDLDFKKKVILTMTNAVVNPGIAYLYRLRKGSLSHSMVVRHSDYSLFLDWLNTEKKLLPEQRINLEEIVFNGWWNCLRVAYCSGTLSEHFDVFKSALLNMQNVFVSDVLARGKNKKRIFIYNLGRVAVCVYFGIVIKNKLEVFDENKEYFE